MATTTKRSVPPTVTQSPVSLADTGDIVAAVAGKKIIVWELILSNSDATKTVKFRDGTTDLTGAVLWASYSRSSLGSANPVEDQAMPLFETTAGASFNAVLSAAANVAGHVAYSLAAE